MSTPSSPRAPTALAAATFALACGFAAAQWAGLVESPPSERVVAVVAVATVCGVALAASARLDAERRFVARLVRLATVAAAALAATVAIGVPLALLAPPGWGELADGLARGFEGVPGARWPYAGGDVWVRLTILLAIPLMSVPAAAFALWPPAPGPGGPEAAAVRRGGALLLLLTLFGLAAAQSPPGDGILRGAALLVVVAAWLFLPCLWRARPAAALAGVGATLAAGVAAVPLAAAVAPERPLVESRSAERPRASAERQPSPPQRSRERQRSERQSASGPRGTSDEGAQRRSRVERRSDRPERRRAARGPGADGGGGGERSVQGGRGASAGERDPGPPVALLLLLVLAAVVAARLLLGRLRRSGAASPADTVAELRRALERLGWIVPAPTTLAELEPRLGEAAGAPAAHYVRRLREWRFAADAARGPSRLERRALRRSLAGDGPLSRLRGLWALPPAPLVGAARPQTGRARFSVD